MQNLGPAVCTKIGDPVQLEKSYQAILWYVSPMLQIRGTLTHLVYILNSMLAHPISSCNITYLGKKSLLVGLDWNNDDDDDVYDLDYSQLVQTELLQQSADTKGRLHFYQSIVVLLSLTKFRKEELWNSNSLSKHYCELFCILFHLCCCRSHYHVTVTIIMIAMLY